VQISFSCLDTLAPNGYRRLASIIKQLNEKEKSVVHISDSAEKVLKEYFEDKEIAPIRIFLQVGG